MSIVTLKRVAGEAMKTQFDARAASVEHMDAAGCVISDSRLLGATKELLQVLTTLRGEVEYDGIRARATVSRTAFEASKKSLAKACKDLLDGTPDPDVEELNKQLDGVATVTKTVKGDGAVEFLFSFETGEPSRTLKGAPRKRRRRMGGHDGTTAPVTSPIRIRVATAPPNYSKDKTHKAVAKVTEAWLDMSFTAGVDAWNRNHPSEPFTPSDDMKKEFLAGIPKMTAVDVRRLLADEMGVVTAKVSNHKAASLPAVAPTAVMRVIDEWTPATIAGSLISAADDMNKAMAANLGGKGIITTTPAKTV